MSKETLCSGTIFDEVITQEECLACAVSGMSNCSYDYSLLLAMFNDKERTGIHVTDITGCLKQAYFNRVQPKPMRIHEKMLLFLGTMTHKMLEDAVDKERFDAEMPLAALGIEGTADVVYHNGKIVDFKTTRWVNPANLPYGKHELQVNIYAQLLREQGRIVKSLWIQYIDMSGPTKCRACRVAFRMREDGMLACPRCGYMPKKPYSSHLGAILKEVPLWTENQVKDHITQRKNNLEKALAENEAPNAEPGFLCRYCVHQDECGEAQL